MTQRNDQQFLKLYQQYRYDNQISFYRGRRGEFTQARTQAIFISIGLVFLTAIAAAFASANILRLAFLLIAAICPVLSTAFAAYNALYAFEQQAKLYQDAITNLEHASLLVPSPADPDLTTKVDEYVKKVESIFLDEQGQWGQLAQKMKPTEP